MTYNDPGEGHIMSLVRPWSVRDGRPSVMEGEHTESRGTPGENRSLNTGAPPRHVPVLGNQKGSCRTGGHVTDLYGNALLHFGKEYVPFLCDLPPCVSIYVEKSD